MLSPPAELYDLARQLDPGPSAPLELCDTASQHTEWSRRTGKGILAFATDGQSCSCLWPVLRHPLRDARPQDRITHSSRGTSGRAALR
jgi:hypothetical protein